MALALGVSWRAMFCGKVLAYSLISMALLSVLFGGVAILLLGSAANADLWLRFTALYILYSVYCGVWATAIVSVSAISRTNQQSLWSLLCAWLLTVVLIPRLIPAVSQTLYPIPDRASFDVALVTTLKKMGDSHNPNDPHFARFREQILQKYNVGTLEELPINWRGLVMTEGERLTSVAFQNHYNELHQQFALQDTLRDRLAWLSPYALAKLFSSRLAGTDAADFYEFEQQAETFRYDMIQKLNHHHTHDIRFENDRQQKLDQQVWLDFSSFEYQPASLQNNRGSTAFLWYLTPWLVLMIYLGGRRKLARSVL